MVCRLVSIEIKADGVDPNRLWLFASQFQTPDIDQSSSKILTNFKLGSI
jgi:hypothetical protein